MVQTWKVHLLQMLPIYEQRAIQKFSSQLKLQPFALFSTLENDYFKATCVGILIS